MATSICVNCGREASFSPFDGHSDLAACAQCGGWVYQGPMAAEAATLYSEAYFNGGEYAGYDIASACHALNFRRKLRLIERHAGVPLAAARLLELGSATGEFMIAARARGLSAMLGLEASEYCRRVAATRGLTVLASDGPMWRDEAKALRPSLVAAWDVWEHLPNPAATFDALLETADEDLVVAISTVDSASKVARWRGTRWRQYHPPTHLAYPTKRSLRLYLQDRGFEVTHQRYFGYYRPFIEYARVLRLQTLTGRTSRLMALPVYLNLYDTQLVVARRGRSTA